MMAFLALRDFLRFHLLEEVMPFWTTHAVDQCHGGLFTCIRDDGSLVNTQKYMWSQTRALWTFSALCRRIERRAEWESIADGIFRFIQRHGRDRHGHWVWLTEADGTVVEGPESIITDSFAIMGLVEYHLATGNGDALRIALETYDAVKERLSRPWSYPTAPYPTPQGLKPHREYMQFSLAFSELGKAAGREDILRDGRERGLEVLNHFWKPGMRSFLEYVDERNGFVDTTEGRTMVPGHGIESAYFQFFVFEGTGRVDLQMKSCEAIRCCLERGWDPLFGGLFLGMDALGREPVHWKNHTMKLWWPHTEAMPACLMAWEACRADWCLSWYRKIHDYSFARFPCPGHGEWTQRLTRNGSPVDTLVALPVKDPFHLPRGLVFSIETLNRILHTMQSKPPGRSETPRQRAG
jgi:N-acylglucosamine 2-epimerase